MGSGMGTAARRTSAFGGAALVVWGVKKWASGRRPIGAFVAATGAGLIWQSRRGDSRRRLAGSRGTIVEEATIINRPAATLYEFWRDLPRLPTVIPELTSVQIIDDKRSHWIAQGPAPWPTEWVAEIINEIPNKLLAWRTTEDSGVVSAGSVHFDPAPAGRGTYVRIKLQYDPPAGKLGTVVAWTFGHGPSLVIREGLRRFKQLMEAGEIATTAGQPRGAR